MVRVRLFDTRSQTLKELPAHDREVRIYACGPTVYDRIHLGNARPYVVFMVLKRTLEAVGYKAQLAINITDINDKIYAAAKRRGIPSTALAAQMADHYIADTDRLGLGRPDHEPRASAYLAEIISYISALLERGHAYVVPYTVGGVKTADVYFRVRSDPAYGSLSHRSLAEMDQGEGVEGADRKEDPLDFALWKGRKPDEDTAWDSPWGPGRPGWHIECSTMAEATLGGPIDLHGGGIDLLFPHHENEGAQARCARGRELAAIWMHNGMVQATGEKMAKSVGNIAPLHSVVERFGRKATVLFLLSAHYRQPVAFSEEALQAAQSRARRLEEAVRGVAADRPLPPTVGDLKGRVLAALCEDFNTPKALGELFSAVRELNRLRAAGERVGGRELYELLDLLGLGGVEQPAQVGEEALALLREREAARARRDFATADRLREELRRLGWEVRDTASGPELVPAS